MMPNALLRPFPALVLAAAGACAGVVGFTASAGVRNDMAIATVVAIVAAAATVLVLARRPGFAALVARPPAIARALFVAGSLAVGAQLVWLIGFIIDPSRATWTPGPLAPMPAVHSCASSYWVAGSVVRSRPDIYDDALYNLPQTDPTAMRNARKLGRFSIDNYEYPPPFLLVPRILGLVTPDFWHFRRLWFALNFGLVVVVSVLVARRLDERLGTHAVWLTPYVVAGPAIIATFQVGNVQMLMIAMSALAMYCFDRRSPVLGGALLAFAIAGKLYPGVFVLYLLLQRDWRAVGWTAVWGIVLVAVSVADVGWEPYRAFLHEMPGLMSGEAFSAFRNPGAIGNNGSVPGVVFKLGMWGVPNMGFPAMRMLGWAYTLVVIAGTVWLARRVRPGGREPVVWIIILVLATMRSPFMATYAFFPVMWLATLVLAVRWRQPARTAVPMICWLLLAIGFGPAGIQPRWNAIWTTFQTIVAFALVAIAMRDLRGPTGEKAGDVTGASSAPSPLPA
ncbi:MAG: glycosyltransferase family 87 protein [Vicinamibacteraceae bacterium]